MVTDPMAAAVPESVVICGLGPSVRDYLTMCSSLGDRRKLAAETWGINSLGGVLQCDRLFHMDDVRIQEIRAAARPQSNIANMLGWMRTADVPIYSPRLHPDYPSLVEYPLQDVLNSCGYSYFNGTAAYALAFAIHLGVKQIGIWGCDYTYPNAHQAEKGRACLEFWIAHGLARGLDIRIPDSTSLLDSCEGQPLYGYGVLGSRDAHIETVDGKAVVTFTERQALPTADEIEAAYDHSRHPSPLIAS